MHGSPILVHVCLGKWMCEFLTLMPASVGVSTCLPVRLEAGAVNTKFTYSQIC
jgi:hypothetical protein